MKSLDNHIQIESPKWRCQFYSEEFLSPYHVIMHHTLRKDKINCESHFIISCCNTKIAQSTSCRCLWDIARLKISIIKDIVVDQIIQVFFLLKQIIREKSTLEARVQRKNPLNRGRWKSILSLLCISVLSRKKSNFCSVNKFWNTNNFRW